MVKLTGIIFLVLSLGLLLSVRPSYATQHIEVVSLRTIDSKTFITGIAQRETIFGHDLHYDDNGELKDVNLVFVNKTSDQASIEVKVQGVNLTIKDPATGVSIKYTLPETPVVTSDKVTYNHKGLVWEYSLTKRGTKLSAIVSTSVGLETYKFPFTVTGTSAVINNGKFESDEFVVRRPKIIDANGDESVFNWVQDAGEIKFTLDDTGMALPYTIDPTTTFNTAANADDGDATGNNATFASVTCDTSDTGDDTIKARKDDIGPSYTIDNAFFRWDTSSIPDTATVTAADFEPIIKSFSDSDSRNLIGDYFTWSPLSCADWSQTPGTAAFSTDITGLTGSETRNTIALSTLTSINKTGFTELRVGISGGQPTSNNTVTMTANDDGGNPQLEVTYTIDPTITDFQPDETEDAGSDAVTVTGTDFESSAQLTLERTAQSDIVCTGESVNGPGTSLTATCSYAGVQLGFWNARVTQGSNNDLEVNAVEVFDQVTVSTSTPNKVSDAGTKTLTIAGSGFTNPPTIMAMEKSGESDIACTLNTFTSSVSIDIDCVTTNVAKGLWDVRITTSDATNGLGSNLVTVIEIPVITSMTPDKVGDESTTAMTVNGSKFESDAQVFVIRAGETDIVCTGEVVTGGTQVTATCDYTAVLVGLWDIRVENDSNSEFHDTSTNETRVYERPTFTSISPDNARNDTSFTLTVNGLVFDTVDPAVITLTRGGESTITCTGGTTSATVITRSCPITSVAIPLWSVIVTNGTVLASTGGTDALDIWISLGVPSTTSVTPPVVDDQTSSNFTVIGSNFDRREVHGGPFTPTPLTNVLNGGQVTLTKSGESTIICTVEVTNAGFTQITVTCNTSGVALGFWSLVVTNNDSDTATLGSSIEVIAQIVGNTQDLGDWNFTQALYTSQFSVQNDSTSAQFHQVVGFSLDVDTLIDDQFLNSDTLNGGLERVGDTRWGGSPGTDHLDIESFKNFDDSLTTFFTDTTDANSAGGPDVTLLPTPIEADDISYSGMTFPGRILWFNIGTAGEGDWTCIWEYNDNSTWEALSDVIDGTDCYRNAGISHVQFTIPSDLSEVAVDGVTSYWIRLRIVAPGTPVTNPVGTQIQWETGLWFTIAPSLVASGGNQQYTYFLGGPTMGCCQQIFVGDTGITTPDHADLELGSDYQIQTLAYLNTSSGTNKDIVLKTAAVRIYISSVGTVTADINSGALVLAVANVPSGLQQVTLDASGGTTTLTVLGIGTDSDTTVSVANNANAWNFGTNNSALFFDFVDIEVPKATEVLRWQPTGLPILTIPDTAGTNQPGTLSLPEPPSAGLVMTVGPFIGIPQVQPGIQGNPVPVLPSTAFFGEETGVNLPGQAFFTELVGTNSGTDIPRLDPILVQLLWVGIALASMLTAGGLVAKKTQNAVWGGVAVGVVGLPFVLMGGSGIDGILPMWILIGVATATGLTAALRGFIIRPSG